MRGLAHPTNSLFRMGMVLAGVSLLRGVAGGRLVRKETIVQTGTSIISPTPPPASTPTQSSSSCVGWECGSTSCIPSTTSLLYYICDEKCLNHSTFTYTTTSYGPITSIYPPCSAVPMPLPSPIGERDEEELEKRWTCVPGPTLTSTTHMACSDCHQFPTLTTTTTTIGSIVYESCSSSTYIPTSTPTPAPTITGGWTGPGCWWSCSDSASSWTTINGPYTATPSGYAWCGYVCV